MIHCINTLLIMRLIKYITINCMVRPTYDVAYNGYTAISIKVVHEQSGKVEYERERLLGIALKIH